MNTLELPNSPSLVEHKGCRFVICDAPNDENVDVYIQEFKKFNISHLVRACDPSYKTDKLTAAGITVHEMPFPDGGFPSDEVVTSFLGVCKIAFKNTKDASIGVHCVAGLGRAPVLVAIALIEMGLNYDDAISVIREKRKGAINAKQLKYLKTYKPRKKSCTIM